MRNQSAYRAAGQVALLCSALIGRDIYGASVALPQTGAPKLVESLSLNWDIVPTTVGSVAWNGSTIVGIADSDTAIPYVWEFDRTGIPKPRVSVAMPGVSRNIIRAFDLAKDGTVALTGSAFNSSGDQAGHYLCFLSPDRQHQTVVRTDPFLVESLSFAPDNTLWVVGHEQANRQVLMDNDHAVLRHFDSSGRQLGSFARLSTVVVGGRKIHPASGSRVVAAADRVGIYLPVSGVYIEYSPDGKELGRYPSLPTSHKQQYVWGAAITTGDRVFFDVVSAGVTQDLFVLDRQASRWLRVPDGGALAAKPRPSLIGSEGANIACKAGKGTLVVIEVPEP